MEEVYYIKCFEKELVFSNLLLLEKFFLPEHLTVLRHSQNPVFEFDSTLADISIMTSSEMYHAVDPKLYPDDWVNHQKTIFEQLQDDFLEDETNVMPYDWVPPRESYYTSFLPARFPTTVLPEFPRHAWLMLYGYDPCQELDRQEIFKVTKASEARNLIETRAVTWLERTIRLTGMKNRPFSAIKDAKSSVQVHGKEWRQEQTDFAFTYGGNSKEQQDNVVAILRVRTPGVLMSRDWDRPQRAEHMIAREARTYVRQIIFCCSPYVMRGLMKLTKFNI